MKIFEKNSNKIENVTKCINLENCDEPEKYCFKFINLMKSRKSDNYCRSVLQNVTALLLQAIFFTIFLQIFEKKNLRKWRMHWEKITNSISIFKKDKIPEVTEDCIETMKPEILEEKEKCTELMKGQF